LRAGTGVFFSCHRVTLLLDSFNQEFTRLNERALLLLRPVPADKLYWQPRQATGGPPVYSFGEYLLRSAGVVEQTFGGLTAGLWDDPFEWTLPETLSTPDKVREYLGEVEATRRRGCALLPDDSALNKEIMAPGGLIVLGRLLSGTLARAFYYQGCAAATLRLFSDAPLPRW
jgi:hypothetical protein